MSVESVLHPAKATKRELTTFLEARGYRPCGHLWKWPRGSVHFHWFNAVDNLSFDGVEATIFRPSEDRHKLGPCLWALHTRTRSSGSRADKVEQNELIRQAKRLFGGNFYNDWGGRNRHSVEPQEYRDAASRGLYLAYETVRQHLRSVSFSVPQENGDFDRLEAAGLGDLGQTDPARVLFNALLPFAVASLEGFFSRAFTVLVRYDASAQAYLRSQTRKIDFDDALAVSSGERTLEEIVAAWYSFQNVASLQKAFSEWLGLDFRKLLREANGRHPGAVPLDEVLVEIIERRHRIIHQLDLDLTVRRSRVVATMDDAIAIIDAFIDHLEQTRGMTIRDETVWTLMDTEP